MKWSFTVLFIVGLFLFQSYAQNKESDDSLIYNFINQVLPQKTHYGINKGYIYLEDNPKFNHFDKDLFQRYHFSTGDSILIMKYINSYKHYSFDEKRMTNVKLISSKKIQSHFSKHHRLFEGEHLFQKEFGFYYHQLYRISVPIFFDNNSKAIFLIDGDFGGDIYIYENVNGKWTGKDYLTSWKY